jgi:hypothetical protein
VKILGVLQNQWFPMHQVDRANEVIRQYAGNYHWRALWNRKWLFYGRNLTGNRLREAFGDWCERITWEEATPVATGRSDAIVTADVLHLCAILSYHQPDHVLAFGRIAEAGLWKAFEGVLPEDPNKTWKMIRGPHPCARHCDVMNQLRRMRKDLENAANAQTSVPQ